MSIRKGTGAATASYPEVMVRLTLLLQLRAVGCEDHKVESKRVMIDRFLELLKKPLSHANPRKTLSSIRKTKATLVSRTSNAMSACQERKLEMHLKSPPPSVNLGHSGNGACLQTATLDRLFLVSSPASSTRILAETSGAAENRLVAKEPDAPRTPQVQSPFVFMDLPLRSSLPGVQLAGINPRPLQRAGR